VVGDYLLTYTVSDSAGNAATPVTRSVTVVALTAPDTTAPVITLLGDNPLTLTVGDSFVDPGTTVSDNVDTGLSASVSGSVNTAVVGDYILTYTVTDSSGNDATPVTRTVKVVEATPAPTGGGGGGGGAFGWLTLLLAGLGLFRRRRKLD
jgi:hypothetical protein